MFNDYRLWNEPKDISGFQALNIPHHDQQVEVLLRLLPFPRERAVRFLDVGCGGGALTQILLQAFPAAAVVGVDFSEPMLAQAEERLTPFGDRVRLARIDFNAPDWPEAAGGPFDTVVSRYAIHHVEDDAKRAVYGACFSLLKQPGVFIHLEHVASPSPYLESLWERLMVDTQMAAAMERGEERTYADLEAEHRQRPDRAANRLAPLDLQLDWLREIGFSDVDCYWKCFEFAIFGGYKW